jgi:rubrerythrin
MSQTPQEKAVAAFKERKANPPKQIDNASLYAGSSMYFYCNDCGGVADILPECYGTIPKHTCPDCQEMKDKGWY